MRARSIFKIFKKNFLIPSAITLPQIVPTFQPQWKWLIPIPSLTMQHGTSVWHLENSLLGVHQRLLRPDIENKPHTWPTWRSNTTESKVVILPSVCDFFCEKSQQISALSFFVNNEEFAAIFREKRKKNPEKLLTNFFCQNCIS